MSIGELFILGFFGKAVLGWLRDFAGRFGLGGVTCSTIRSARGSTTTTSNLPSRSARCAPRSPGCRPHRWSSSIRKADMAGLAEAVGQGLRNEQLDPGAIVRHLFLCRASVARTLDRPCAGTKGAAG